jgi:Mg-chelatase subunit ChlD
MSNRDYTLIIDRSGSMGLRDQPGGRSRWAVARESVEALAAHCDELDPDGITLYVFAGKFRRYDNVHAARVSQVFLENEPCGGTDLAGVLAHAFDSYFTRKRAGKVKDGETIVVVTDGEPDDKTAVLRTIIDAARKVEREEELGVSLVQVGSDAQATRFLKVLDDDLVGAGARFDIVDTVTLDEMEDIGLTEVLLRAIYD